MAANTGAGTGGSKIRNAKLSHTCLSPPASDAVAVEGKPMALVAEKLGFALVVRSGTNVGRDVFEASDGRLHIVGRMGAGIGKSYLVVLKSC
ncbi:hypothetical protein ZWY2020_024979 [Hordeum vulgare]|nr:hypothetical protein ZWY2020_024979 [Hordeum vulgare]